MVNTVLSLLGRIALMLSPLGFVIGAIEILFRIFPAIGTKMDQARIFISTLKGYATEANLGDKIAFWNAIFPLYEAFLILTALIGLKVVCVVIRLIKGVIPTYG
jgi:hypothetical protein